MDDYDAWWQALQTDSEYDPALCFVVTTDDGTLAAFAQCWTSGWIKDIAVDGKFRRRGIARALLSHIFSIFQCRGAVSVGLKVHSDNSGAVQLYQSVGMVMADEA